MKLAVLYSGGKDSNLALHLAKLHETVACLITIDSSNAESYMFHTPNIKWTELQASKLGIPIIVKKTTGVKEEELNDLKEAIKEAIEKYSIEGIVTGAVDSIYQASRVQKICDSLNIECFNPLWQKNQMLLLEELQHYKFEVLIVGVAAFPFDETWLGKKLDNVLMMRLKALQEKIKLNPAGEGGEYETFVINSPDFSSPITITDVKINFSGHNGVMEILEAV